MTCWGAEGGEGEVGMIQQALQPKNTSKFNKLDSKNLNQREGFQVFPTKSLV